MAGSTRDRDLTLLSTTIGFFGHKTDPLASWPALLGTYKNTEDAIEAARDRQKHLERLADSKKCPPI